MLLIIAYTGIFSIYFLICYNYNILVDNLIKIENK